MAGTAGRVTCVSASVSVLADASLIFDPGPGGFLASGIVVNLVLGSSKAGTEGFED
jgi:hypothetical protein